MHVETNIQGVYLTYLLRRRHAGEKKYNEMDKKYDVIWYEMRGMEEAFPQPKVRYVGPLWVVLLGSVSQTYVPKRFASTRVMAGRYVDWR